MYFLRRRIFNIIFAGTTSFSSVALEALIDAGHQISLVMTKPDAIAGRGHNLQMSAVKKTAIRHNLPIIQPRTLKSEEIQEQLKALQADFMVVVAYGLILPSTILDIPKHGCLNIHASLLPRWRGAAPIQRALLTGDKETGITVIQMDAGLDTGDILLMNKISIDERETSWSLTDKLSKLGAQSICYVLEHYSHLSPEAQNDGNANYAAKITKSEAKINWHADVREVDRCIRVYDTAPCAYTTWNNECVKIWRASIVNNENHDVTPGTIIIHQNECRVACGSGWLSLHEIQCSGRRKMTIKEFLMGTKFQGILV